MKVLMPNLMTSRRLGVAVSSLLIGTVIVGLQPLPTNAQKVESVREAVLPAAPSVLAAIRQAPFSQIFTVDAPTAGEAFGIKDRDFQTGNRNIGVYSLWFDAPAVNLLQVALMYCLPDNAIARSNAHVVAIELIADGKSLVKIDQPSVSTESTAYEVVPAQYVPNTFFTSSTFSDPFWSPFYFSNPYLSSTYVEGTACSLGGSRLDLAPVKAQLATLPNQTLTMRLLFNNGMTSDWRLGRGTVAALKQLPTIKGQ